MCWAEEQRSTHMRELAGSREQGADFPSEPMPKNHEQVTQDAALWRHHNAAPPADAALHHCSADIGTRATASPPRTGPGRNYVALTRSPQPAEA